MFNLTLISDCKNKIFITSMEQSLKDQPNNIRRTLRERKISCCDICQFKIYGKDLLKDHKKVYHSNQRKTKLSVKTVKSWWPKNLKKPGNA